MAWCISSVIVIPDGVAQAAPGSGQPLEELVGAAAGVGADQHLAAAPAGQHQGPAAADRYLNFLDHVSHISCRICVADQ